MRPTQTALWLRLTLPLGLALVCPMSVGLASARAPIYVSSWAVRVSEGYREAERLARKFGFVNLGQVGGTRWTGGGGDWITQDPRPRQTGGCLSGPLGIKNSQPTPASTNFRFWDSQRASEAHTRALGWGRMQAKGLAPVLRGLHQGSRVPARLLLPHIPRSSLMGSTSTCGTGAWSSSP